jgi:hypothetical protein
MERYNISDRYWGINDESLLWGKQITNLMYICSSLNSTWISKSAIKSIFQAVVIIDKMHA